MATTERLSPAVMQSIAGQIAQRLPAANRGPVAPGAAAPSLGESLRVRMLPLDAIRQGHGPLAERLKETGQWHHQVYQGQRAMSFARSTAPGAGPDAEHDVVEVVQSSLPEALQDAIAWIDEKVPDDADASIVVAPAYFLTAVWLKGPSLDAVVIASIADGLIGLSKQTLIPSQDFLRVLAENEPIQGLGPIQSQLGGAAS